jgi:hypothetical protein
MQRRSLKSYLWPYGAGIAAILALFAGYCAYLANGPDRELSFTREVPTSLPLETLHESIWSISNWPEWFYSVSKAERVDIMGRPLPTTDQSVTQGALIRLEIQPHKGERRGSFDLLMQVTEFIPQKRITMRLTRDGSGRIQKIVERLEWKIEIEGQGQAGAKSAHVIRATATARTCHWRSRVIGGIASRVLMNQLFYPNVMALGLFTQPRPPNPFPAYGS